MATTFLVGAIHDGMSSTGQMKVVALAYPAKRECCKELIQFWESE